MDAQQLLANESQNIIDIIIQMFEAFRQFWGEYGQWGLFIYSIIETITPIAGVEVFFISLLAAGKTWWSLALVATTANLIGAMIVFFFMAKEDNKFYNKVLKKEQQVRAQKMFTRYGMWAIFIFAMTPLPFFIIIFTAAIARMKFTRYILSVLFARGTRFFITTALLEFSAMSTGWLILTLFLIALPITVIMFLIQTYLLPYLERRAEQDAQKADELSAQAKTMESDNGSGT